MKLRLLLLPLALAALAVAAISQTASAQQGPPGPSAGTKLAGDLLNPRGMTIGPDGMLYVAEAGTGGDTEFTLEGGNFLNGFTGRISKIDPATGTRTTVVDGLPSNASVELGDSVGPADVAFIGGALYYVQTHGGAVWGFPDHRTGVYRVRADGSLDLIADIGRFNIDNPVSDITDGVQQDIEPGGNPYSMMASEGALWVVDGNQNQLMKVELNGTITRIAEVSGHMVTTGIARRSAGPFYVSTLGAFPFSPEDGRVYSVALPTGTLAEVARGYSALTDVEVGPGGQLYALQFAEQATDPNGPPLTPFSGKVLRVNSDGTMTPIVTGFTFATNMQFRGDTLYVTNNGIDALGPGEVWKIENFSSIQPPAAPPPAQPTQAPAATATPAGGAIAAPDTGSGGYAGDTSDGLSSVWLLALMLGGIAALAGGTLALRAR